MNEGYYTISKQYIMSFQNTLSSKTTLKSKKTKLCCIFLQCPDENINPLFYIAILSPWEIKGL